MALQFRDDILAPKENIFINYSGPNPLQIYKEIDPLSRLIFQVKGTNMFVPVFKWDIVKDPRPFFIYVSVRKPFDKSTKMQVDIIIRGHQPSDKSKSGNISIMIGGFNMTTYHSEALKPFIFLYHVAYYNNQRRRYLVTAKRNIERLEQEIRSRLKIPLKPI